MTRSSDDLDPLIRKLQRLGPLSGGDVAAIRALPIHVRFVKHSQILVHEGHAPDHCTLLLSGVAARERTTSSGGRQLVGLYVRGDFIDLNSALIGCAHDSVQVLGDAEIACIPFDLLIRLAFERPAVGRALWLETLLDASIAREWTLNLGRRNARTRLLHLICEFATRQKGTALDDHDEFTLPMTQEQLADSLGLTPVHVNRMLQSLRENPAIERVGRTFRIKNWRTLKAMAEFDGSYLEAPADAPRRADGDDQQKRSSRPNLGDGRVERIA